MNKYHYSVIRFVPSPARGEFVNLGLIVGSDDTGEWVIDVAKSRARATKLDDHNVFPLVAANLQQLQSSIESYSDTEVFAPEIDPSIDWLFELARDSQSLLQFSVPSIILAPSAESALERLGTLLVVDPIRTGRSQITKQSVVSQLWSALQRKNLGRDNLKKHATLDTSKTRTTVDVVAHNGVVQDITQCWSLQVKDTDKIMDDIKSWAWTMKTLRDHGGAIHAEKATLIVPTDVRLGVVYAPSERESVTDEALEVFTGVGAEHHTVEQVEEYAEAVAAMLGPHD